MFERLGRVVVHHPWRVIIFWVIAAAAIVSFAPKLQATTDEASFLPSNYESIQAQQLQERAFPGAASPNAIIVVKKTDGGTMTAADTAKVSQLAGALRDRDIDDVTKLQPTGPTPNRQLETIGVYLTKAEGAAAKNQTDAVKHLRDALHDSLKSNEFNTLRAGVTGDAAAALDAQDSGSSADAIVAIGTILLILVLLLVIFRAPLIAILPIVTIGVVSQIANGLIGWASELFDLKIDSSVTSILIVVLFGVGTDYILFLTFRYRERLRAGEEPKQAMVSAVGRVGEAISSAAGAVIVAFLALLLSTLGLFRALGPALAIAVFVTVLAGLTLIPAVMSLLGTKVFWPSKSWQREPTSARFTAIGTSMGRHPGRYAAASGLVLAVLCVFAFGFKPNFDLAGGSLPDSAQSQVWQRELFKSVPAGATEPSQVYLRSNTGRALDIADLGDYRAALAKVDGVGTVGAPTLSADKSVAQLQVTLDEKAESSKAIDTVTGPLRAAARDSAPPGTSAVIGGITAVYADIQRAVNHDYALVFPVAAVIIMIILGLLLRSLVAPWYLMISVGLGFGATLGASTLVFQHAGGQPGLIFMLPIIMYLFVVALGTDYNILMVARLREEANEGRSPREGAARAIHHTGPTVAAAGLILAGSFAVLMLAGTSTIVQIGFAVAIGIAIASFVMALFFTPAVTALLGHRAWWPRRPAHDVDAPRPERDLVGSGSQP